MPHDRSNVHEQHLLDILGDYTESPADRRVFEAWTREHQSDAFFTLLLADTLLNGLESSRWPWSDKQPPCSEVESEWVFDKQGRPGRRLRMRHCNAAQGHDGAHTFGEWGSR